MLIIEKICFKFSKGPTKGLNEITLIMEAKYSVDFSEQQEKSFASHYNGSNSVLFVNEVKIFQFKAKDSELNEILLCLGNV